VITLAFDSETWPILPGLAAPPPVCLTARTKNDATRLYLKDQGAAQLKWWLNNPDILLVTANGAYDACVYAAYYPELLPLFWDAYAAGRIRDVQVREKLLDIAKGRLNLVTKGHYSLAGLAKRRLGIELAKGEDTWRLRYAELDGVPLDQWPQDAKDYALKDAETTLAVWEHQDYELQTKWPFELPSEAVDCWDAFCLNLMRCWGIRTNKGRVQSLNDKVLATHQAIQAKLIAEGLLKPRPLSAEQKRKGVLPDFWQEREPTKKGRARPPVPVVWGEDRKAIEQRLIKAYAKLGDEPPRTEPTTKFPEGQVKQDGDAKEQSGDPLLVEMSESGPNNTIRKTFLPALWSGVEVPICPEWNGLVETGRLSCRKPNLTNQPRDGGVRECFEAREGHAFIAIDFDAAEMRGHAQNCLDLGFHDAALARFFQRDPSGDPHCMLVAQMLGITYERALELKASGDEVFAEQRVMGKVGNFGLMGGMGPNALRTYARSQFGIDIPLFTTGDQIGATELKQAWLETWPENRRYFKWVNALDGVNSGTAVVRIPVSGMLSGGCYYTNAANRPFQGRVAVGAKRGLRNLIKACYLIEDSALFNSRVLVLKHDEYLIEVPLDSLDAAAREAERIAKSSMQEVLPDIPVRCSAVAMKFWSKKAKRVERNGKIVPYDLAA
jgi:DNA polymerase I